MNELEIIEKLRRMAEQRARLRSMASRVQSKHARSQSKLILGIGDDCAILRPDPHEDLLFKADQVLEGAHFGRDQKPELIGQRALGRALSDIASMGGRPLVCLVALSIPRDLADSWITGFYRGLLRLASATGTQLAGGDLSRSEKIYCDIALCGSVPRGKALRRDGARPGDAIYISGRLGKRWDRPIEPRLELGHALIGKANSCMDISDGIALDLHRLCKASNAAAEIGDIPVVKGSTLDKALHGGEDYELLFTIRPGTALPKIARLPLTRIGNIVKASRALPAGAVLFRGEPLPPRGYDHFAESS
jgi:thiamine-monophosphate kinase